MTHGSRDGLGPEERVGSGSAVALSKLSSCLRRATGHSWHGWGGSCPCRAAPGGRFSASWAGEGPMQQPSGSGSRCTGTSLFPSRSCEGSCPCLPSFATWDGVDGRPEAPHETATPPNCSEFPLTPQYPSQGQPCALRGSASAAVGENLWVRENKQPSLQPVRRSGDVHVVRCCARPCSVVLIVFRHTLWTLGIRLWRQVQRLDEGGWTCVVCLRNSPCPCASRSHLPLSGP